MGDRLTEAEVAEVENRARYYRDIGKVERDFCATIRETVCLLAERRALREALAEVMQVHDSNRGEYFMHDALVRDIRALAAEPAARGEQHEKPEADALSECSRNPSQQGGRHSHADTTGEEPPPAPLDDAAVLRLAESELRETEVSVEAVRRTVDLLRGAEFDDAAECAEELLCELRNQAHDETLHVERLRQPPEPAPEPDVFEAFEAEHDAYPHHIAVRACKWFGQAIALIEKQWAGGTGGTWNLHEAGEVLAQLRARAKEASRG